MVRYNWERFASERFLSCERNIEFRISFEHSVWWLHTTVGTIQPASILGDCIATIKIEKSERKDFVLSVFYDCCLKELS